MKYSVGGEVDTLCGRCKIERTHRIVALDPDGSIVQVICATCDSRHKYKAPKLPKATSSKPRVTKSEKVKTSAALSLDEMMAMPARPYAMSHLFQIGEIIEHVKFGRGQVIQIQGDKIEVHFGEGVKLLVHGR